MKTSERLQVGHIRFGYCLVLRELSWLERTPDKREVSGSSPLRPTIKILWQTKTGDSGGVAQLGEHLPCKQGVRSSILLVSTKLLNLEKYIEETK